MNIACVTAHPDDAEILCAGTKIKYIQKGHRVTFIIATNGEVGSPTLPNEEIANIRYEEAKEGARIVGADLIWLGFPDEFLFDCRETRLAFLNALRKAEPDVVFTHYHDYYNCDHNEVHKITNDVGIHLTIKNIPTETGSIKNKTADIDFSKISCKTCLFFRAYSPATKGDRTKGKAPSNPMGTS